MDWIEIIIDTSGEGAEVLSGLVIDAGINGLVVDDPADIRDMLEGTNAGSWNYIDESLLEDPDRDVTVKVYVPDNNQGRSQWETLRASVLALRDRDLDGRLGALRWDIRGVKDEDWENNWKVYFKPIVIGEKLVVKPTWERWETLPEQVVLEIDPGSSFGTGQHETTRMCLEFLEEIARDGMKVLDLGCGSGILMTTALLLGARYAVGVDIEENAIYTSAENLALNGFGTDRYALFQGDLAGDRGFRAKLAAALPGEGADLITANIVANTIIQMAPYFAEFLEPGGKLLASGIISGRRQDLISAMAGEGYELEDEKRMGEWGAFLFKYGARSEL